ncbi:MAG: chemotaxis protein CheC [Nanoarchaeota archaeon]
MDNFKTIITAFAKQSLGGLAGELLLDDYCNKFNIKNLSSLDEIQKKKFINAFIYGVFHKHMSKSKIDTIRLHVNLLFCLDNATKKISTMLNKDVFLNPLDMKYQTFENFEKIINNLGDGVVVIPVHVTGYVSATILIFIYRDSAILLGNIMLKSMLGIEKSDDFFDDMKQSAIQEFFNIVIPTFADTIANTLNQEIFINLPETEITDVQKQIDYAFSKFNFDGDENYGIKKIMSTSIGFVIDKSNTINGMCFLLLESEPEIIYDSLGKSNIKIDDTLESMNLEKIELLKDPNRYKVLLDFLINFIPENTGIIIDNLMEELGISSLNNVSVGIRRQFVKKLINDYFSSNSKKIVDFIQNNCEKIFNIGSKIKEDDNLKTTSGVENLMKKNK